MKRFLAKLWPFTRGSVEVLGWATLLSLAVFTVRINLYEHRTGRRYTSPPIEVSPVAERIASRFSPTLQALATEHKDEAINSIDGAIQRWCVGKVWGPAYDAIPRGTEIATNAALDALCNLPMGEVASDLNGHARSRGKLAHWSIRATAEGSR